MASSGTSTDNRSMGTSRRFLLHPDFLWATALALVSLPGVGTSQNLRSVHGPGIDVAALEAKLRTAAAKLPFFDLSAVLYGGRLDPWNPPEVVKNYPHHLHAICDPALPVAILNKLIRDEDPRVRSCAAVALFDREDPQLLPTIAALLDDPALGVPALGLPLNVWRLGQDMRRVPRSTTPLPLSRLAQRLLGFWSSKIGGPERAAFDAYWRERKKRRHCIGWLDTRIRRATHSTSETTAWDVAKLRLISGSIDALPPIERELAFIYHAGVEHGGRVVDALRSFRPNVDLEAIHAARRLGPQRLMKILRGEPVNDDPDWRADQRYFGVIQRFIVAHAHEALFRPEHAAALLAMGWTNDAQVWGQSQFARMAARLQPKQASKILRTAMAKLARRPHLCRERVHCADLLLELTGSEHRAFLLEWFYEDHDPKGLGSAPPRVEFIDGCFRRLREGDLEMLTAIVADPRFGEADYFTVRAFLLGINAHSLTEVVSRHKLYSVSHPYGMLHFHGWLERGVREHPGPTKAVLATLKHWRTLVPTHLDGLVRRREK